MIDVMQAAQEKQTTSTNRTSNQPGVRMWPSLEAAVRLYDVANVFLVVSLALGVAATVAIIWAGGKKEEYAERAAQAAERKIAELSAQTAASELERIKLEERIAPRRLSGETVAALTASLGAFRGRKVSVLTYALDAEGAVLGSQIIESLMAAGIDARPRLASFMPLGGFAMGIVVDGPDARLRDTLATTLGAGGLTVSTGPVPGEPEMAAKLLIGVKPPPIK